MASELQELDVVALLEDLPEHGLSRGQVGTLVHKHEDGVFEVEFADNDGRTYAIVTIGSGKLMQLHHQRLAS